RPACSASTITGTRPAHDTRWSSSNTADCGVNVWDTRTGSAFLELDRLLSEEHQSSQLRGHFPHADTPTNSIFVSGSRLICRDGLSSGQAELALILLQGAGSHCSPGGCYWLDVARLAEVKAGP